MSTTSIVALLAAGAAAVLAVRAWVLRGPGTGSHPVAPSQDPGTRPDPVLPDRPSQGASSQGPDPTTGPQPTASSQDPGTPRDPVLPDRPSQGGSSRG